MKNSAIAIFILSLFIASTSQASVKLLHSALQSLEEVRFQLGHSPGDKNTLTIVIVGKCESCPSQPILITDATKVVHPDTSITKASSLIANIIYQASLVNYHQKTNEASTIILERKQ